MDKSFEDINELHSNIILDLKKGNESPSEIATYMVIYYLFIMFFILLFFLSSHETLLALVN